MRRGPARHGRLLLAPLFVIVALIVTVLAVSSPSRAQTAHQDLSIDRTSANRSAAGTGNISVVVGCVVSTAPTDIAFAAQPNGALAQPLLQLPPSSSSAVPVLASGTAVVNGFDLGQPWNPLECGAIVQDSPPDIDANPNTVDTGTITYSLQTLGGRFAILNDESAVYSVACAQTTGAPAFEGCTGGILAGGGVTPNPALIVKVGLAAGVPLSSFGNLAGVAGINGLSITATYTRDPSLSANPAAVPPGPESASSTTLLGIFAPTYQLTLAASQTTIPASPQFAAPGNSAGSGLNDQGSTLTASLATVNISAAGAIVVGTPSTATTVGAEPGTVTFTTNLGVFGDLPSPLAAGRQTVSVACGQLPGYTPAYNPATFGFFTYSFASCQTATATLYGGGQAGQATVVATYVGGITGVQAQSAIAIALSLIPSKLTLARGCNQVITPSSLAPNTPASTYVYDYIVPSGPVTAVWQYNNATQRFQALYFTVAGAPTIPNPVVGPNESLFVCLASPSTVTIASPTPTPSPTPAPSSTPPVVITS